MGNLSFSSNGGCADDGSGRELVQRVIGRVEFHDEDVSGIFAKADCAEDAGVGDVGGLMSMCFFFFLGERSGIILTMMGGGWWAYLWKESQREMERDGEYCQYTKYHTRQKRKKKKQKKIQLYLSNNAQ